MSLLGMLREEGKDIWIYANTGFFANVQAKYYDNAEPGKHVVFKNEGLFGVGTRDRLSHELGHMVCCKDENVLNPYWDFNHFINAQGTFTDEQSLAEAEVLYVGSLLEQGEVLGFCHAWRAVNDTINAMFPFGFGEKIIITNLTDEQIRRHLDTVIPKWTEGTILHEALRKYELIRSQHS